MALTDDALVTWAETQDYLGLEDSDQDRAETLINMASGIANRYTGRKLAARDYSGVQLDGSGRKRLCLPEYPVNSVASLYVDPDRDFGADTEVTDYELYSEAGIIYRVAGFERCALCVKITYNAGFATVPWDLRQAVMDIVQWSWQRVETESVGVKAYQNPDGISHGMELTVPMSARHVFERYERTR
jgi:hypothetical protein